MRFLNGNAERMRIDSSGNVGIGTTSPTTKLQVAGIVQVVDGGNTAFYSGNYVRMFSTQSYGFRNSAGSSLALISVAGDSYFNGGNVGIGTTSPSGKLMISDANNRSSSDAQFRIEGAGYTAFHYLDGTEYVIQQNSTQRRIRMMSGTTNGVLLNSGATAWTSYSDETLKENIKPLVNVLDKIKNYRCVEYNFKNDKGKKIGFIAQDWENDFAPIVNKDEEGLLGIKYTETIPVLLKAIQELKAEIEILKNK